MTNEFEIKRSTGTSSEKSIQLEGFTKHLGIKNKCTLNNTSADSQDANSIFNCEFIDVLCLFYRRLIEIDVI